MSQAPVEVVHNGRWRLVDERWLCSTPRSASVGDTWQCAGPGHRCGTKFVYEADGWHIFEEADACPHLTVEVYDDPDGRAYMCVDECCEYVKPLPAREEVNR